MAVENRPRKSTLSKIGKMFGVPEKHDEQQPSANNSSSTFNDSVSSSLNSSTSSLNQLNISSETPKKEGSQQSSPVFPPVVPHMTPQQFQLQQHQKIQQQLEQHQQQQLQHSKPTSKPPSRVPSLKRVSPPNSSVTSANNTINASSLLSRSSSSASNHPHTSSSQNPSTRDLKHQPRFIAYEDGTHEHHLKNAKRQEKLSHMLKNLLGAQKLRDEAVSAVPEILTNNPPTLFSGLVTQMSNNKEENIVFSGATRVQGILPTKTQASASTTQLGTPTFAERYGRCQEVVGKGTFGVVRIAHKKDPKTNEEKFFAVKEFKRKPNETDQKYSRRLTSEFCISSSLKHQNIIETLDLLQDAKKDFVQVMEYCSGGDLYTLIIAAGKLEYLEADCFFKQLIRGVNYMHGMGVAHRDLKPENLLLTEQGVIKITDFGNGECFKMAWEDNVHLSGGICGSSPYIAPEEYNSKEFDPRSVDIWACGVIYMAMRTGRHLWRTATQDDEFYLKYLEGRKSAKGYEPIELLKRARCRNVIYSILDPMPTRRINGKQILNSEWGREIKCCLY